MILEKTGAVAEYYSEIIDELFDGYLGDANFLDIGFEMDDQKGCINEAMNQVKSFFKEIDFEFLDRDIDTVMKIIKDKAYSKRRKIVEAFIALSSNAKIAFIAVTVLNRKTLMISVLADKLEGSRKWIATDSERKELLFYDLFIRSRATA